MSLWHVLTKSSIFKSFENYASALSYYFWTAQSCFMVLIVHKMADKRKTGIFNCVCKAEPVSIRREGAVENSTQLLQWSNTTRLQKIHFPVPIFHCWIPSQRKMREWRLQLKGLKNATKHYLAEVYKAEMKGIFYDYIDIVRTSFSAGPSTELLSLKSSSHGL